MPAPHPVPASRERQLGPAFDDLSNGLVLVGAPPAVGKTCLSLNLAVQFAAHLGELVLYFSPAQPKEVLVTRLAKNLTPEGEPVDTAIAAGLPLVVLDAADPTSTSMIEAATAFVEKHGTPTIVLVNDLQSILPGRDGLSGVAAAIEIMADLRGVARICDAPVVLFSQLAEGKGISSAVADQTDRVVTVALTSEDPTHKHLQVSYFDPPEPEATRYPLTLIRATGVVGPEQA